MASITVLVYKSCVGERKTHTHIEKKKKRDQARFIYIVYWKSIQAAALENT